MAYVVTGASGFIGTAVVNRLATARRAVIAVSRRPLPTRPDVTNRAVTDYAAIEPESPEDVLIHLAQPSAAGEAQDDDLVSIVEHTVTRGWRHIVYASSATVYGDSEIYPRRPDELVAVSGRYASLKFACERLVARAGGTVARIANVYGPAMSPYNVVSEILAQIPGTAPVCVRDLTAVRDYLWIGDAATGLATLAEGRPGGIYNLGTGRGVSVGVLARLALCLAGEEARPVEARETAGRGSHLTLDAASTLAATGWRAEVALETGLARLVRAL